MNQYPYINWTDGMKLNKSHFVGLENSMIQHVSFLAQQMAGPVSYGLLPSFVHPDKPLDFVFDVDRNNSVSASVYYIQAVTSGGFLIDVNKPKTSGSGSMSQFELQKNFGQNTFSSRANYLCLTIVPFERRTFGTPESGENPPRNPFAGGLLDIDVIPEETLNQSIGMSYFSLPIAKFKTGNQGLVIDENYIPPCTKMSAHPDLVDIFSQFVTFLSQMERDSTEIIMRIYSRTQTSDLAQTVLYIMRDIQAFVSQSLTLFKNAYPELSPVYTISYLIDFARTVKNSIDSKGGSGKEVMLNYYKNWIMEMRQGEFEQILINTLNLKYQHYDISNAFDSLIAFTTTMSKILRELSTLDYIGENKRTGPVIDTRKFAPTAPPPPPTQEEYVRPSQYQSPPPPPQEEPKQKSKGNRFILE